MAIQREEQGRPRRVVERVSDAARRRLWGTRDPLVMLWNPRAVTPLQRNPPGSGGRKQLLTCGVPGDFSWSPET